MVKFLHLKSDNAWQIHDEMLALYGNDWPSYDTTMRWEMYFESGHMSLTDEARPGRSLCMDDEVTVKKVESLILEDS